MAFKLFIGVFSWFALSANIAIAARSFDIAKVGQSTTEIEGDSTNLTKLDFSSEWKVQDWLFLGPTLGMAYSDNQVELYDRYRELKFGLNVMVSYPFGRISPYYRFNPTLMSYFQAEGKVNSLGIQENAGSYGYTLEGQVKGYENAIGAMVNITSKLSLLWELSYTSETMGISNTRVSNKINSKSSEEQDYEKRKGVTLDLSRSSEDDVKIESDSSKIERNAKSISFGMVYRI